MECTTSDYHGHQSVLLAGILTQRVQMATQLRKQASKTVNCSTSLKESQQLTMVHNLRVQSSNKFRHVILKKIQAPPQKKMAKNPGGGACNMFHHFPLGLPWETHEMAPKSKLGACIDQRRTIGHQRSSQESQLSNFELKIVRKIANSLKNVSIFAHFHKVFRLRQKKQGWLVFCFQKQQKIARNLEGGLVFWEVGLVFLLLWYMGCGQQCFGRENPVTLLIPIKN